MNTDRLFSSTNLSPAPKFEATISITIQMPNGTHSFTLEEARALQRALGLVLGNAPAEPVFRMPSLCEPLR